MRFSTAVRLARYVPGRDRAGAPRPLPSSLEHSVNKAADNLGYLGPQCAELNEGLRNVPARGLGSRTPGELRDS